VEKPIWIVQGVSSGSNNRKSGTKGRSGRFRDRKARIIIEHDLSTCRLNDENEKGDIWDERESRIPNTGN
jgi:hypothetical protein